VRLPLNPISKSAVKIITPGPIWKFRGQGINGDWFTGLLSISHGLGGQPKSGYYICNSCGMPWAYNVRPETVTLISSPAPPDRDDKVKRLVEALKEISRGAGRYSHDSLTHADNCIEDMKELALTALAEVEK